jgi:hypothetical protein
LTENKPLKLDMDFGEAIERFSQVAPREANELIARERCGSVPLVEDARARLFGVEAV